MHFPRRPRVVAITILIGASTYALLSIGQRFRVFDNLKEKILLQRRDGSTITFSLPWISSTGSPVLEGFPGDTELAGSSAGPGRLDSNSKKVVSVDVQKGPNVVSIVASILGEAAAFIDIVIDDSTTKLGGGSDIVNSAAVPNALSGPLNNTAVQNSTFAAIFPQTSISSSFSNLNQAPAFKPNVTAAPMSLPYSPLPSSTSADRMSSSSCPGPSVETCTITETWHSTHYESTATMYSFMETLTLTCTETVSVCPPSNPFNFNANTTISAFLSPSLVACANGGLARRVDDCPPTRYTTTSSHPCPGSGYACAECPNGVFCPPAQTSAQSCPGGIGWACGHCSDSWYCLPVSTSASNSEAINTAASLLFSTKTKSTSSAGISATHFSFDATNSAGLSSIIPSQVSPALNQITSSIGDSQIAAEITFALANIQGLTGTLLNIVVAQVASIMAQADGGVGTIPSVSSAVNGLAGGAASIGGSTVQTGTAAVEGIADNGGVVVNSGLPGLNTVAGNIKAIATNKMSKTEETPAIPIMTVEVHPLPADPGSSDGIAAALDVLNGGIKGRRRAARNLAKVSLEDLISCVENPDDGSC